MFDEIKSKSVLLKSVAINNEKGGPKTTQHRNAIKQSASTKVTILFLLDKFLSQYEKSRMRLFYFKN